MSDENKKSGRRRRHSRSGSSHKHKVKVKVRKRGSRHRKRSFVRPAVFGVGFLMVLVIGVVTYRVVQTDDSYQGSRGRVDEGLPELPPNRWIKIGRTFTASWHRQKHAGAAYDTHRNKYFVFGSDTHGENWDNSIHEFDPLILRWLDHYPSDRRRSYQVDGEGHPVAGNDKSHPWAMHVHDNLLYDPTLDALMVMAAPVHNPALRAVRGVKQNPTWIYELKTREWRTLDGPDGSTPFGFAGASAYDSDRDVIVAYSQKGIWELGPERQTWLQASPESHHEMYQSMVYDPIQHEFLVFGGQEQGCSVWAYKPGLEAGEKGSWEERTPSGDACVPDQVVPAAFDIHNGAALLIVDNPLPEGEKKGGTSSTFVYDPQANTYQKLAKADLPRVGMNYTLVYDAPNRVFYMLRGGSEDPPTVWALHLELLDFDKKPVPGG